MMQGMDPCIVEQSIDQGVNEGAMDQRVIVAIEGAMDQRVIVAVFRLIREIRKKTQVTV
jgi:hypothetical protein